MPNQVPNLGEVMATEVLNTSPVTGSPGQTTPGMPPTGAPGKTGDAAPPVPAADSNASAKLNALIRREKAAIQREQSAKTLEAQIQAKAEVIAAKEAKYAELENLKNTNPRKALELLGLSYQDLTQVELNDGNLTPEIQLKKLEEKFERSENDRKAREEADVAAEAEAAKRSETQMIEDFQREIGGFLKENSKKYELINFEGQDQLVYEVINAHYERTIDPGTGLGKIMTIADASDRVEKYLKGKYEKAKELDTVKSLWAPVPPAKQKMPEPTRHKPPTLTNNMSATPSRPRTTVMTDEERIQKAIAYAKGLRP